MICAILPQIGVMRPPDHHYLTDPRSKQTYASTMPARLSFLALFHRVLRLADMWGGSFPPRTQAFSGLQSESFHPLYPLSRSSSLPWQNNSYFQGWDISWKSLCQMPTSLVFVLLSANPM